MPDSRHHRGPSSEDEQIFAPEQVKILRKAFGELCWLLDRGYAMPSCIELVGNRYALTSRQRLALARCGCSAEAAKSRASRAVSPGAIVEAELWIDGLNVVAALEVALSGGVILVGRDGCCRDLAGIHRQYRRVEETIPALRLVGEFMARCAVRNCRWWLDRPVSNTGRLKECMHALANEHGWNWEIELVYSPDAVLAKTEHIVVTADSAILDRCQHWLNLVRGIVRTEIPTAWLIDLSVE
jgi:hypothetical protein